MLQLTRRNLLTGAAATVALGTAPQLARAAAPIIGKQGPSFYRYKVGDFEVPPESGLETGNGAER